MPLRTDSYQLTDLFYESVTILRHPFAVIFVKVTPTVSQGHIDTCAHILLLVINGMMNNLHLEIRDQILLLFLKFDHRSNETLGLFDTRK